MFKNYDKVFKFTFKNQVTTKGYKSLTIGLAIFLFVVPILIAFIYGKVNSDEEEEGIKECGAEKIYVVNEIAPDADYSVLNMLGIENYTDIKYVNSESVEKALADIKDNNEENVFVLQITDNEDSYSSRIIIPEGEVISEELAGNYNDFIDETGNVFAVISSGVSAQDLVALQITVESDTYKADGYKSGTSLSEDSEAAQEDMNNKIKEGVSLALVFISVMFLYMIIIVYGNGIMQSIVLEKSSKLMDTMLLSVKPEAMILGKMLGMLGAAFLQIFSWIAAAVVGCIIAVKMLAGMVGSDNVVQGFVNSFGELNLFRPVNVIIAVLVLIFGIIVYTSLTAICGAISSTKEEAASNQMLFVVILLISFYAVIIKGMSGELPVYLSVIPFTAAMVLPAKICTGTVSVGIAALGLGIMILTTVVFLIVAGKLYKMLALYKGNTIKIGKALKMLAGGRSK